MRRVFILFTFLCGFCSVPGLATTDDIFRQSDDRFTAAASRFENKKNNYFSSVSVEEIRQQKRTHNLTVAAVVAASFFLLVGLGMLTEKLLKKHRVLSRVRLSAKKRHGSHTLDDVFEIEKRG